MKKIDLTADNIIAFIGDIFARRGNDSYLGEVVTMSQHMLQGAHQAERAGADDELVAAALLHDIGHYTSEFPADMVGSGQDNYHENAGAKLLEPFFSQRVTDWRTITILNLLGVAIPDTMRQPAFLF